MSDNEKQFANAKFRDFCAELGIKNYYSSPAHPQPNESDQLRLDRHQGLSARSPVAHTDEFIYSAQVTQSNESD